MQAPVRSMLHTFRAALLLLAGALLLACPAAQAATTTTAKAPTVTPVTTSTTLSVSPSKTPSIGTAVLFSATVKGSAPTGTITFTDGGKALGTAAVAASGVAGLPVAFTTVGNHAISATYSGDSKGNQPSTAAAVTVSVQARATSVTLVPSSPQVTGKPITLKAGVNGMYGSTGTVTFTDSGKTLGSAALAGGIATLTGVAGAVGNHTYGATFSGNATDAASTASVTLPVNGAPVTLSLSAGSAVRAGVATTLTVTLTGANAPTGTLQVGVNGILVTNATLSGNSTFSVPYTFPSSGTAVLGANYFGDTRNQGASASIAVTVAAAPAQNTPVQTNGIQYHGGSVMSGGANLYYIWYGNWTGSPIPNILTNFAKGLGGSPYYHSVTSYSDSSGKHVSDSVVLMSQVNDNYSQGKALDDSGVAKVVFNALNSGKLPQDPNGVYVVMGAADVNETSGMCTTYCGWHSQTYLQNAKIRFSFIGNPDRCLAGCAPISNPPNGSQAGDGMVGVLAHELAETVTDPDGTGWFAGANNENGDLCVHKYGTVTKQGNISFNLTLPTGNFITQQLWLNDRGGQCVMAYP